MRMVWAAVVCAMLALAGCFVDRPGDRPLTAEQQQAITNDVRALMNSAAHDVTQGGPGAWRAHFEDVPSFFMVVNGQMAFSDSASATEGIQGAAHMYKKIELTWGKDVRVDPLTLTLASVASPYHEMLTDSGDHVMPSDGFFTALVEKHEGQWQFRNVHWSVPVATAVPSSSAKEH